MNQAWFRPLVCAGVLVCAVPGGMRGQGVQGVQEGYRRGQNVTPLFEGWEQNPDGTFNMVFAYFNSNWDEALDIPVGPDNQIEPGGPDQGQPTRFLPRRNQYVFHVQVPKNFDKNELVWTLTAHGKTERAYASLRPEYILDPFVKMANNAGASGRMTVSNQTPMVKLDGDKIRTVKVGEPVTLVAFASDDGIPPPTPSPVLDEPPPGRPVHVGRYPARGLRVAWFVYRGAGQVTFDPEQFNVHQDSRPRGNSPWTAGWAPPPLPPDGKYSVKAAFGQPGTYVLRCLAHDGGLWASQDVTVTVTP